MDKRTDSNSGGTTSSSSKQPKWIVFLLSFVGLIYLLSPTFGIFELIPDIIPIVGNLDEGAAAILVWQGLQLLLNRKKA